MSRSPRAKTRTISDEILESEVIEKLFYSPDKVVLVLADGSRISNWTWFWDRVRYVGLGDIVSYRKKVRERWYRNLGEWGLDTTTRFLRITKQKNP